MTHEKINKSKAKKKKTICLKKKKVQVTIREERGLNLMNFIQAPRKALRNFAQ